MMRYGVSAETTNTNELESRLEELRVRGFVVLHGVLGESALEDLRHRIDAVYAMQVGEVGLDFLEKIGESDVARCPVAYDDSFVSFAAHPVVLAHVRAVLGDFVTLHLQNAIINRPGAHHHQAAWHRDLPYQDWTSSKPLALSALFCVDPFSIETGGTTIIPGSHRLDRLPSDGLIQKLQTVVSAAAGSVLLFDSMVYHRAGVNKSNVTRRGLNQVYTIPILKQQIDLPAVLNGRFAEDPKLSQLLGYTSEAARSTVAWRERRFARLGARTS